MKLMQERLDEMEDKLGKVLKDLKNLNINKMHEQMKDLQA
jgi:hypothetical protein